MSKLNKLHCMHDLVVECVKLKHALGEAGLLKSMHAMDTVTQVVGYEVADQVALARKKLAAVEGGGE